ncbi:tripartite tricarboxylate transporter permease [Fredinandcohnia onubensis]|uniref:tripartite tricarboxylate transporter permease n=1 Tax=Fredinandcohnia onubensis TaxID=1571209 RepID=UPI000C0C0643|nr:tripartite tricarboxylate transporter permease [Fredinandcohnia onubensis]
MAEVVNAFATLLSPENLLWIIAGVLVGTVFGAIPGLTATTGIALFLPLTFSMDFTQSMAFLLGIYTSGFWSGSIPAILVNTPGAPGNAATVFDGYPMAKQGRAGDALGFSILSSFIGGIISAIALYFLASYISKIAINIASPEYFSLGVLALVSIGAVSGENFTKGIAAGSIGVFLSTIGIDPILGTPRLTFDIVPLLSGIAIIPALVGLFAVTEVFIRLEHNNKEESTIALQKTKNTFMLLKEMLEHKWVLFKSVLIGILIGALPGTGPGVASFIAYNEAKRSSKKPETYGKGNVGGVISVESSNNAVTGGALIPLLTLGIPGDTVTAILIGALIIQGIQPGPSFIVENYDLFTNILAILVISNILMLVVGLFGSKLFPLILKIRTEILMPVLMVVMVAGGYAYNHSLFDIQILMILGIIGYFMYKFGFPIPPLVIGLVLGPIVETNFRRALLANDMDVTIFFTRPISLTILLLTIVITFFILKMNKQSY